MSWLRRVRNRISPIQMNSGRAARTQEADSAQRSAQAAKEIKELISSSVDDVDSGMHVVRSAGDTMHEIVTHADQVRQLLDEVANGAREQSMGNGQIGQAVQDLDRNTQANATLVDQTAVAAASQRTAAVRMAAQVDEFTGPGLQRLQQVGHARLTAAAG